MEHFTYFENFNEISTEGNKEKPQIENERVYQFEEAIALTETGKFHYGLLFICGCCITALVSEAAATSSIMPYIKCDIQQTVAEQSMLNSVGFLGIILGSHPMSLMADTWSRVKTLRVSLGLAILSTIISTFSINPWMLIIMRFFASLFISGCQSCAVSFMAEFHGNSTRSKYITILCIFFTVSAIYSPLLALAILPIQIDTLVFGMKFSSWRLLLLSSSLPTVIALCGLLVIPESPKYDLIQGRHQKALRTFKMMFKLNTGKQISEYPVNKLSIEIRGSSMTMAHSLKEGIKLMWDQTVQLFSAGRIMTISVICLITFAIGFVCQSTSIWLPTMLYFMTMQTTQGSTFCETITAGVSVIDTAVPSVNVCNGWVNITVFKFTLVVAISVTMCYFLHNYIHVYLGKKISLVGWTLLAGFGTLGIHWSSSYILSAILLIMIVASINCGSILVSVCVEYFPTNINAMAVNFTLMIGCLGSMIGSIFVGMTLYTHCHILFSVLNCMVLIPIFLSVFLPKT